ncbi:MAG: DMT family transporter [Planctomycetota bacterium]|jgi:drug/metabolite transporter (DMT)-like permease
MHPQSVGRLQILAAAVLFSTGGAAIKACGLTGWQVAGFRSGVGALALYLMLPGARRGWTWRTYLVGVAYAATLLLYVLANKLTTASNTIFLQSTAPLYLLLVSPLLLKETIRLRELIFMAALAGGLGLYFMGIEPPQATAPDPRLGNLLAAAAGLGWGLTIAGLRWLARAEGVRGGSPGGAAAGATVVGNAFVFLFCLPFAMPVEQASASDWLWVVYLGVFQIALAYVFMTKGMRTVRALESGLLLLVEPVLNTLITWVMHGEVPGYWSRLGAAVILVTTVVHSLFAGRGRRI